MDKRSRFNFKIRAELGSETLWIYRVDRHLGCFIWSQLEKITLESLTVDQFILEVDVCWVHTSRVDYLPPKFADLEESVL